MPDWKSKVSVRRGDITKETTDVIVNAANERLLRGGGVCGAIHAAAGQWLEEECAKIGGCATGDAVITAAYDLPCRKVVHTVGPRWSEGGGEREDEQLASCYGESIRLAAAAGLRTIAFPSLGTGIFGFPIERASGVALAAIKQALLAHPEIEAVHMVCFSDPDREVYENALSRID